MRTQKQRFLLKSVPIPIAIIRSPSAELQRQQRTQEQQQGETKEAQEDEEVTEDFVVMKTAEPYPRG